MNKKSSEKPGGTPLTRRQAISLSLVVPAVAVGMLGPTPGKAAFVHQAGEIRERLRQHCNIGEDKNNRGNSGKQLAQWNNWFNHWNNWGNWGNWGGFAPRNLDKWQWPIG